MANHLGAVTISQWVAVKSLSDAVSRRLTALQHPKIAKLWGVSREAALQTIKSSVLFRTFASSTAHVLRFYVSFDIFVS